MEGRRKGQERVRCDVGAAAWYVGNTFSVLPVQRRNKKQRDEVKRSTCEMFNIIIPLILTINQIITSRIIVFVDLDLCTSITIIIVAFFITLRYLSFISSIVIR